MNRQFPRITIVTPSFNQGAFLRETIDSVLNQNYPNLEYFIVDGGSTDNSIEIIREYEDRITWWVSEPDQGQADAIHKGFARASGELIAWLNSDDVYFPDALHKVANAFIVQPDASIYMGAQAIGDLHDGPIRRCVVPGSPWTWFPKYNFFQVNQQSSFYNTSIYHKIGGINQDLYMRMDGDLHFRLLHYYPYAVVLDDLLGFIRWHGDTKTSSRHGKARIKEEQALFRASFGVSNWLVWLLAVQFRLLRLIDGYYFRSMRVTQQFKGKRMSDVWAHYQGNRI